MKTQYRKMYDAIKFSEEKFNIFKDKVYQEYRAKIIEIINKKDKQAVHKLETVLERYIDYMGNVAHKDALLNKEVKLKNQARREVNQMKDKNNQLVQILESKKGYCSRDQLKVIINEKDQDWE